MKKLECESELNSEARRLESQAKQAMVDAQRQAEISLQLVKRYGTLNSTESARITVFADF